jgi:hypothetical protein
MRYALVFAVLAIGLAAMADDDAEKKYTSKEGNFSVQFPAGAKVKTKDQEALGGITLKITTVDADMKAYAVITTMFPAGALKTIPAKAIFDGAEQGAAGKSGGTKVSTKELEFGTEKFPGREFVVEKEGKYIRTQMIIADPKLYVITVAGPKDYVTGKEGTAFLKSFEILKPAKPEK